MEGSPYRNGTAQRRLRQRNGVSVPSGGTGQVDAGRVFTRYWDSGTSVREHALRVVGPSPYPSPRGGGIESLGEVEGRGEDSAVRAWCALD
jgi:hypothetical protein